MKTLIALLATCILVGYAADTGVKSLPRRRVRQSISELAVPQAPLDSRRTFLELRRDVPPIDNLSVMQLIRIPDMQNGSGNGNHIDFGKTIIVLTNTIESFALYMDVSLAGNWEDVNGYILHESETGKERIPIDRVFIRLIEFEHGSDGNKITSIAIDFGGQFGDPTSNGGRLRVNSAIP